MLHFHTEESWLALKFCVFNYNIWRIIRAISLIGEVENSSRERALVAQRLETGFLIVRWWVRFPPGSVDAHC